jgi:uncharacterized protein YndB with AHSA1/START domain
MSKNTVMLHRALRSTPEKIYRAFTDADAMCKWFPPYGFTCKVDSFEPREGGVYKMSFTNFSNGKSHSFGGKYVRLIPNEKIVISDEFDDPNLPGIMTTSVIIKSVSCGVELNITPEGIPEVIPLDACYLGWQESLEQLAKLVEPEINE